MSQAVRFCQMVGMGVFLGMCLTACNAQTHKTTANSAANQQKESALRDLRDSGVITEQDYQDRLTKLRSGAPATGGVKSASSPRGGGSGNSWKLKKVDYTTEIGYDAMPQFGIPPWPKKQAVAASILAPADWDTKIGPSNAPPDCNAMSGKISVVSISPDKKYAFILLPGSTTVWSNNRMLLQNIQAETQKWHQSCAAEQPAPMLQRAREVLHKMDASMQTAGEMQPIPGLTDKLPAMLQQANANLAQQSGGMGQPPTLQAEAGRLHFTHPDPNDPGEGYIYIMQTMRTEYSPYGNVQTVDTPLLFITGAPQGKLESNELLFQAMAGSLKLDPEYQAECLQFAANIMHIHEVTNQRLNQISQEMAADNARTAAKISSIQQGVSQYRNQVMNNVAANRSAALEHSSQQFSMYMGDQAMYRDSSGRNVQLPSGAGHVWASSTGNTNEYILTDSASYDPNGRVGSAGWTEMREVR